MTLDATDTVILSMLQENARTSNAEIARALGIAPSAVLERIRKLEQRGVIRGYHADIDPTALGYGLTAFVNMRTGFGQDHPRAVEALSRIPEILEIHETAGEDCLIVKVRCQDIQAYHALLNEKIRFIEGVHSTRTTIVIGTAKETRELPLDTTT
ncbi:MAG: Lrp/AsnC family transcriptional regulator [Thermomicrobiales bacterium]|nr:Lrp/AsnC family transcriptional regulator [Thermomicrobiales bacterium]